MTDRSVASPHDRDVVNTAVSGALAIGSLLSAAVLAIGLAAWVLSGARHAGTPDAAEWLPRLGRLEPSAIMFAGLALVTLIPVAQLVAALAAFARQRDWRHTAVTAGVLAVVLISAGLALAIGGTR